MTEDTEARRRIAGRVRQLVWLMDPGLREVHYISPVYEEVTGRALEEAGNSLGSLDIVHPEDREAFGDWFDGMREDAAAAAARDRYVHEFRILHGDGDERWITSTVVPLREGEEVTAFAGFSVDVTAQLAQERAFMTRIGRLDDFASMVAHDLRNPLSVAMAHLEFFRENGDERHLESVEQSLARIEEIADETLSLARHGGNGDVHERVSLGALAAEAWEGLGAQTTTLVVEDDVLVDGVPEQLRQLLENLISNAVDHGGEGVTVRLGAMDGGFFVEDTGVGVPASDRRRVFDHGHTTGDGFGVGLTVVHRVAEAHGWAVTLDEGEEGGARFEFRVAGADASG